MYSSSIFCIIVTVLVFVECKNLPHCEKNITEFNKYEEVPESKEHGDGVKCALKEWKCQPTYTHVPLKPMMATQEFLPSVAYVKRCTGHCSSGQSCVPTKTSIIKVPAKLHRVFRDSSSSPEPFVLVYVEEHTQCKCVSRETKKDCTAEQYDNIKQRLWVCKDKKTNKNKYEEKKMTCDSENCSCGRRTKMEKPCRYVVSGIKPRVVQVRILL